MTVTEEKKVRYIGYYKKQIFFKLFIARALLCQRLKTQKTFTA